MAPKGQKLASLGLCVSRCDGCPWLERNCPCAPSLEGICHTVNLPRDCVRKIRARHQLRQP